MKKCSFCGSSTDKRYVAGQNNVFICSECIKISYKSIMQNKLHDPDHKNLEELLVELNDLTGLSILKGEILSIVSQIVVRNAREEQGLNNVTISNHLVFMGNPGTGKTMVARIVAKIYRELGVLSKGHLIETDRSGLVAGFVGQTALKTKEIADKANGGILFIDEAYSLSTQSSNDFGKEAIDTLLKIMEDNRDDFIVIVAGYDNLMREFLKSNPGLESRFNTFINFEDYSADELYEIFLSMCEKNEYVLEDDAVEPLKQYFSNLHKNKTESFANARTVRNFFEKTLKRHASRLVMNGNLTDTELIAIAKEDLFNEV